MDRFGLFLRLRGKRVPLEICFFLLFCAGLSATGGALAAGHTASPWQYVRIPISELTPEFVHANDFIRDHLPDDTYAFGYLKQAAIPRARANGNREIIALDGQEWAHFAHNPKTLARLATASAPRVGPYEDYHTYQTLTAELQALAAKYPQLVTLYSAGKSVQGLDLWYVKITASQIADPDKPKLLYISSMHGDEVVGKELMVYLIRDLLNLYGTDPQLTAMVNYAEIYIMPSMNPDGTNQQQRFNANNQDLNRNFPGLDEGAFSTDGRESETVAVMNLHRDNHFVVAMNLHGGAVCVNIPWDSKPNPDGQHFGDDQLMLSMANDYASHNGPMNAVNEDSFHNGVTYGYEWYQVLGGMQDWADFFQQSTHATLELSDVKWPDATDLPGFWSDNRQSLVGYFQSGMTGFHLKVTDATGKAVPVDVDMATATRTLHYDNGVVHRPAVGGSQTVTLKATGFQTQTLTLTPALFNGSYQTVVMKP